MILNRFLAPLVAGTSVAAIAALGMSPAQAQSACSGTYNWATVSAGGFSCTVGDKTYSDFTNPIGFGGQLGGVEINFSSPISTIHNMTWGFNQATNPVLSNPYSFDYKITITDPLQYINTFGTSALATNFGGGAFTKTLTALNPAAGTATATATAPNTQLSPPVTGLSKTVTAYDFRTAVTVSEVDVKVYQDQVTQAIIPPVPGPLPLLGAGAAFGLSRKLRRRIRAAA